MKIKATYCILLFACCIFNFNSARAQKVLIVNAHPDDETGCAATVYKITHDLKGVVDIAIVTNGEGGYKYSTLAEDFYHLELTDEKIGRENLPRIRKEEMMKAGNIIGIRNYYFFDQWDRKYTTNERDPLDTAWDVALIKKRLDDIMRKGNYDYVFCLLPTLETHGHHKAATMLALETINQLPKEHRPIILGVSVSNKKDTVKTQFTQLKDYVLTAMNKKAEPFVFNRSVKFGYKNALNYNVIVDWEKAEHKSQGTVQTTFSQGDYENFWYFQINDEYGIEKTRKLFEELKKIPYPVKTY